MEIPCGTGSVRRGQGKIPSGTVGPGSPKGMRETTRGPAMAAGKHSVAGMSNFHRDLRLRRTW